MLTFLCRLRSMPWVLASIGVLVTGMLYAAFKLGEFIIRRILERTKS